LIITSRPEDPIASEFQTISHHPIVLLSGNETDSQTKDDIQHYFEKSLPDIEKDWVEQLVRDVAGLLIWAQTAVKYIKNAFVWNEEIEKLTRGETYDTDDPVG
jgi:hypothetical protein